MGQLPNDSHGRAGLHVHEEETVDQSPALQPTSSDSCFLKPGFTSKNTSQTRFPTLHRDKMEAEASYLHDFLLGVMSTFKLAHRSN